MRILTFISFFIISYLSAYEPEAFVNYALIQKFVPVNPIVIEAGGLHGEDVEWKCRMWPNGKIYAFEPVPDHFEQLKKLILKYDNLEVFPLALSNFNGESKMYIAGGASSLLRPLEEINKNYFKSDLEHPITVNCITMKDWAKQNEIQKIDFLWLDAEGMELPILKGMPLELLNSCSVIFLESSFLAKWENCTGHKELLSFLKKRGFKIAWQQIEKSWGGNFMFVNTHV